MTGVLGLLALVENEVAELRQVLVYGYEYLDGTVQLKRSVGLQGDR